MKPHSMRYAVGLMVAALCTLTSCRSPTQEQQGHQDSLTVLARSSPFITETERPHPVPLPDDVVILLRRKKESGQTDHLGLLVEYGLRVHWQYLQHTRLARELPVESNMMLAELIRIADIPKYTSAHEAGWLNSQFYGKFNRAGWSSYQIYVWVKEHFSSILTDDSQHFPNAKQILDLIKIIDCSALNGVGGGGVCHYECL
jgi:hypothetical protein